MEHGDQRRDLLLRWLGSLAPELALQPSTLRAASADASFRRYFRLDTGDRRRSVIAVDAPPAQEDSATFVALASWLRTIGVQAPEVIAADLEHGLMLVGDLGERTYLDALAAGADARPLYADALATLIRIQAAAAPPALPDYDRERLRFELGLFPQWYVGRHLGVELDAGERARLERCFDAMLANHLAEPRVVVHRDYHCRNLMATAADNPGVLDFQGALRGPASYDLVSLLRDAYVEWDEAQQIDWAVRYWQQARGAGLPLAADFAAFWRDVEWMGLQRHLKVLGLFARLAHRDGKARYLADCPRVLGYARLCARRYDELAPIARLLDRLDGVPAVAAFTF